MTEEGDVTDSPSTERGRRPEPGSNQDPPGANATVRETSRERGAPNGDGSSDADGDPLMPEPMSTPVLSGQIEREHAAFVVLGALATVAVFLQLSGVWL